MNKLSIVIVNYNVQYFLEQCLHSCRKAMDFMVEKNPSFTAEIWVVDNNSKDESVAMLNDRFSWVSLIANKDNKGFSTANNQAIKKSNAEHILLLNPDTVVEEDTFYTCMTFMDEHKDAGGLGVKMIDGKGKFLPESKRGLPAPDVAFYKIFGFSKLFPTSKTFGKYHLGYLAHDETNEVEVLAGAFMLLRNKCLEKIGWLDETFFMYGEDVDLSYRIILGGYKNYYLPSAKIIHYKGESTKKDSVNYVFVFYKAMVIFAQKHFQAGHAKLFAFLIHIAIYLRAGFSIVKQFFGSITFPILDGLLHLGILTAITQYYELHFKQTIGTYYPDQFYSLILPIYSALWVVAMSFSGTYRWKYQIKRLIKGSLLGGLFVSLLYAFISQDLRFSRAIVLFGTGAAFISFYLSRWLWHLVIERHPNMGQILAKKMLIIGEDDEVQRVSSLLKKTGVLHSIEAQINPSEMTNTALQSLKKEISQKLSQSKIEEVIFCSKNLTYKSIVSCMMQFSASKVSFKIVPHDSLFIIGSDSKNQPGDYYTIDDKMQLRKPEVLFNKRFLDIFLSVLILVASPLLLWTIPRKSSFLANVWNVLSGRKSWVGYSLTEHNQLLPRIKKGILKTADSYRELELDHKAIHRMDISYARNYHFTKDIQIIINNIDQLGN